MQHQFKNTKFLKGFNDSDFNKFLEQSPLELFSEKCIDYLSYLSKEINKDSRLRNYPDVSSFSFFCRKSNILQLKRKFYDYDKIKLGRGVVFHIAPSNVPVNFAFSLVMGLISGNLNIVRVPSKEFEQIDIIVNAVNSLAKITKFSEISDRIIIVRYDRGSDTTKEFSLCCNVRIIWGGDKTINQIRENKLPPRAFDVTFADRYSICVINANKYINYDDADRVANDFYNDTYLFDQNACTSPHLVLWIGSNKEVEKSKNRFWNKLHALVKSRYQLQSISTIDKLTAFYNQAIETEKISIEDSVDNSILRVSLDNLNKNVYLFRSDSGYFCEYHASSLDDLAKVVNAKYQTLSYFGFSKKELTVTIKKMRLTGIDRVVPIGRTMDFSVLWDGYNFVETLSRGVEII